MGHAPILVAPSGSNATGSQFGSQCRIGGYVSKGCCTAAFWAQFTLIIRNDAQSEAISGVEQIMRPQAVVIRHFVATGEAVVLDAAIVIEARGNAQRRIAAQR